VVSFAFHVFFGFAVSEAMTAITIAINKVKTETLTFSVNWIWLAIRGYKTKSLTSGKAFLFHFLCLLEKWFFGFFTLFLTTRRLSTISVILEISSPSVLMWSVVIVTSLGSATWRNFWKRLLVEKQLWMFESYAFMESQGIYSFANARECENLEEGIYPSFERDQMTFISLSVAIHYASERSFQGHITK
jgi:hypothetical protein